MTKKIRIISKREGFRRCSVAHSEEPTFYDLAAFTEGEIRRLTNETMLVVDIVEVDEDGDETTAKVVAQAAASKAPAKTPAKPKDAAKE